MKHFDRLPDAFSIVSVHVVVSVSVVVNAYRLQLARLACEQYDRVVNDFLSFPEKVHVDCRLEVKPDAIARLM